MARISTVPLALTFLLLGLLAKQGLCRPSNEDPNYKEDYANDDYEDSEEDEGDQYTGPPPTMISQPLVIEAHEGDTVTLPCESTNLAQLLISFASIWKKEASKFLFTDGQRGTGVDLRYTYNQPNNSLVIHNIKKEDAGIFQCTISYTPSLEIQHTVHVFAPAMIKGVEPAGQSHTLKKGSSLTLKCNVTGYPPPTVQWTKKGKHSSEVVPLTSGPNITLNSVDRQDSGIYECSAENDQGPKASSSLSVRVVYAPEINVEEEVVATSENYDANLKCNVHADPKAAVHWLKNNEPISPSDHIQFSQHGHIYSLDIKKVQMVDFAKYTCRANNSQGAEVSKPIELTGKPNTPRFVSATIGPDGRSLDVEWHIISYSPMVEYKLLYKQTGEKIDETWHIEKPSVTEAESSNLYKLKHTLENLKPGDFLVSLRARNDYGWSSQAKPHPFKIAESGEKEENHEATAETSKMEDTATEQEQPNDSTRPRIMAILTIISLSSFFL